MNTSLCHCCWQPWPIERNNVTVWHYGPFPRVEEADVD